MYRERPADLPGAVLWTRTVPAAARTARVLPDGCLDLIWSSRTGLLVAGPDRVAQVAHSVPGERYVGLRLPPGVGPAVFGVPACELRDQRVPLADLWPHRLVTEISERAAAGSAGAVLTSVAVGRLRRAGGPDPVAATLVGWLAAGEPVGAVAARVGLGVRHLHRRCQALFGYGPKTLARILRMGAALDLARSGVPLAEVAVRSGYADQAHLTREVRDLAGVPPGTLLRAD
ncbi:helix-turn-helix transcriptional regulator [Micromonospora echinofusca]|uniref:Helix-turn-helix domain-containing protein n=1 Tax=Micromonospora echinofusca TaxID=47858 RepID=A0ABS3VQI1_MICEH|nr:helix-turn-helix transcriptional regulator [Micromonospora echinofusca]MBO4206644.1 helix-turn-helix domain-containing protein [Micromonospora echinofusca]